MQNDEKRIAVFIDFENIAMGVRESKYGNFNIDLVLKRLVEKGKIMVKRAYSDWHRYADFKRAFHQAAIELIDVPQTRYSGKNSADIRMVVDALDLSYQKEHIDTFVLVSGDSDSPLSFQSSARTAVTSLVWVSSNPGPRNGPVAMPFLDFFSSPDMNDLQEQLLSQG